MPRETIASFCANPYTGFLVEGLRYMQGCGPLSVTNRGSQHETSSSPSRRLLEPSVRLEVGTESHARAYCRGPYVLKRKCPRTTSRGLPADAGQNPASPGRNHLPAHAPEEACRWHFGVDVMPRMPQIEADAQRQRRVLEAAEVFFKKHANSARERRLYMRQGTTVRNDKPLKIKNLGRIVKISLDLCGFTK